MRRKKKLVRAVADRGKLTLTIDEVAAVTGIGKTYARRLVIDGVIPSVKLGRKYVIARPALMDWLASAGKKEPAA